MVPDVCMVVMVVVVIVLVAVAEFPVSCASTSVAVVSLVSARPGLSLFFTNIVFASLPSVLTEVGAKGFSAGTAPSP